MHVCVESLSGVETPCAVHVVAGPQAEGGSLLAESVRLSELFRPQTFLNAVRQQTARHTGASMDSLKVGSPVEHTPPLLPPPPCLARSYPGWVVRGGIRG